MFKYLLSYLIYHITLLIPGGRNYDAWKQHYYRLQTATIKNKKLAQELEQASKTKGFLTFAEYLAIDQFGKNGYHNTHKYFGKQQLHMYWKYALATFCKEQDIATIIELGPGDGTLGAEVIAQAEKEKHTLTWRGVEINTQLYHSIRKNFDRYGVSNSLLSLVATPTELPNIPEKSLLICSFSLDSIAPEILVNTTNTVNPPNNIIGVTIENIKLSEIVIPPSLAPYQFSNGVLNNQFNLQEWKLHPWQRAYIPLEALTILAQLLEKMPRNSSVLIIDEVYPIPNKNISEHLGLPKNLATYKRSYDTLQLFYAQSGDRLLYFPLYHHMIEKTLRSLGCSNIVISGEKELANKLAGRKVVKIAPTLIAGILATKTSKPPTTISIGSSFA